MKRILGVLLSMFMASTVFGLTNTLLIDFNQTGQTNLLEQAQSATCGTNEEIVPLTRLHNSEWVVHLNSSAQETVNRRFSYTKDVTTLGNFSFNGSQDPIHVLGVRIHFPVAPWSSYAIVKPAYELEFFGGTNGKKYEDGRGVIKNVGTIKEITSWVVGRNFNIAYIVNVRKQSGELNSYSMGSLNFRGWNQTKWKNIHYLSDVRDRILIRQPLYPVRRPAIKLESLQFFRSSEIQGGNFVTYVKDVRVEFEEAIPPSTYKPDVNDEGVWGILEYENDIKKAREEERIRNIDELRQIEREKSQNYSSNQ